MCLVLLSLPSPIPPGPRAALCLVSGFAVAAFSFILCLVARVIFKNVHLVFTPRLDIFPWLLLLLALETVINMAA